MSIKSLIKTVYLAQWQLNAFNQGREHGRQGASKAFGYNMFPQSVHSAYDEGYAIGTQERLGGVVMAVDIQISR
jgi:hypothetical protein